MYKFNNFLPVIRLCKCTDSSLSKSDKKRLKKEARMSELVLRRFWEALELLPERERKLFLLHIKYSFEFLPFYMHNDIPDEKNRNYALVLINRSSAIVEEYFKMCGMEVHIPRLQLNSKEKDTQSVDNVYHAKESAEDHLAPYRSKALIIKADPQELYEIDHLSLKVPSCSKLSEKELVTKVKELCKQNDIPEELRFCCLSTAAEYMKEGTAKPILVVGNPGSGKTYFGNVLAEIMGLPFYKISGPGAATGQGLTGDSPSYLAASYGEIVRAQYQTKATNPVILIDEIDKCGKKDVAHYLPDELLSCLDGTRVIHDNYLRMEVSTIQIPFVITANEIMNVPAWLKDRCITVEFPDPSKERIVSIIMKRFGEMKKGALYQNRISMDREAFERVVSTMYDKNVHSLRQYSSIVENAAKAAYIEMLEEDQKSISISDRHFAKAMKLIEGPTNERRFGFALN